jgi:hypothetical protein
MVQSLSGVADAERVALEKDLGRVSRSPLRPGVPSCCSRLLSLAASLVLALASPAELLLCALWLQAAGRCGGAGQSTVQCGCGLLLLCGLGAHQPPGLLQAGRGLTPTVSRAPAASRSPLSALISAETASVQARFLAGVSGQESCGVCHSPWVGEGSATGLCNLALQTWTFCILPWGRQAAASCC